MGASRGERSRRFATTRWSVVLAAARTPSPQSRRALSTLCTLYWYPLYAFARRRGHEVEQARDLTQGFFARLLEKKDLAAVGPGRGRFRTWLLAAFKHFLANAWDHARAQKRGGGAEEVSIDAATAESRYRLEPPDRLTPEKLYHRRWALDLLDAMRAELRAECATKGKLPLFEALEDTLGGDQLTDSPKVADQLGMSPGALSVAAHRLRQRYGTLIRRAIAQTVERPEEVDDELRALLAALGDDP